MILLDTLESKIQHYESLRDCVIHRCENICGNDESKCLFKLKKHYCNGTDCFRIYIRDSVGSTIEGFKFNELHLYSILNTLFDYKCDAVCVECPYHRCKKGVEDCFLASITLVFKEGLRNDHRER